MSLLHIAGLVMTIQNPLIASDLSICVENPARVDSVTVATLKTELRALAGASRRQVDFGECRQSSIRITLRAEPPSQAPDALGATRLQQESTLPDIEIYVNGIARLIETRLPGVLGRAMARVTIHEMGHYLNQSAAHEKRGFMSERLGAAHLLAGDARFFRLAPLQQRR